jgi:hypothetical protein
VSSENKEDDMMRILSSFGIMILMVASAFAQAPDIEWRRTYTTIRGNNEGWMVQETRDGGLIIVGQNGGYNGYDTDIYLIKTDSQGDTLWTRDYDSGSEDYGRAIRQTLDGGYAIGGYSWYSGTTYDIYLLKIDSLGNVIRRSVYHYPNYQDARSLESTPDGGFILAGSIDSLTNSDVFIIRTDSIGDTVWTRRYGGIYNDKAWSIKNTHDGGFIVAGWSNLHGEPGGNSQIYVLKLNGAGDSLWTRLYGTAYNDEGRSILELPDHRFIVAGKYGAPSSAHSILFWLNENGDSLWSSIYNTNYEANSIASTFNGGFIFCGFNYSSSGIYSEFVRKTDSLGNSLWGISGEDSTYAHYIIQTSDSGYVFVGYSSDSISLTKISPERPTSIHNEVEPLPKKLDLCQNYPNPFNASTLLSYRLDKAGSVNLAIYNLMGQRVAILADGLQGAGEHQITWNSADNSSGIYFARLVVAKNTKCIKLVVIK